MNDLNLVQNSDQAVEELIGEHYAEWLMNKVGHDVSNWPEVHNLASIQPKIEKIRKFMLQLFLADEALVGAREGDPGFLRFAIANLSESPDPAAEAALEIFEARRQDEMAGHRLEKGIVVTKNRELWVKLLKALEIPQEEINRIEPKEAARNYIAELSDVYSNAEWQTVVGAFAALQRGLIEEYTAVFAFLKNNTQLAAGDLELFAQIESKQHKHLLDMSHLLEKIAFDQETKTLIWEGVERHLTNKKEFYSALIKNLE